jgi:hypothetical protein
MEQSTADELVCMERVRKILHQNIKKSTKRRIMPRFVGNIYEHDNIFNVQLIATKAWEHRVNHTRSLCNRLFEATEYVRDHLQKLDKVLTNILRCNFVIEDILSTDEICENAIRVLSRLPSKPTALPDALDTVPQQFFLNNQNPCQNLRLWENLKVVSFVSTNTICTALFSAIYIYSQASEISVAVNFLAVMLDEASKMSRERSTKKKRYRWIVVRAFLWSTWQRMMMLMTEGQLKIYVRSGFDHNGMYSFWIRPFSPSPGYPVREHYYIFRIFAKSKTQLKWTLQSRIFATQPMSLCCDNNYSPNTFLIHSLSQPPCDIFLTLKTSESIIFANRKLICSISFR